MGEHVFPGVPKYTLILLLVHGKNVIENGRKKVNHLHSDVSNRDINFSASRLLWLVVVRPPLE